MFYFSKKFIAIVFFVLSSVVFNFAYSAADDTYGDWARTCDSGGAFDGACFVFQNMVYQKEGESKKQQLMKFALGYYGNNALPVAVLVLPTFYNIGFINGVHLKARKQHSAFKLVTCSPESCILRLPFDKAILNAFTKQEKVVVAFQDIQGKPFVLPLSLKGFDKALAALDGKGKKIGGAIKSAVVDNGSARQSKERANQNAGAEGDFTVAKYVAKPKVRLRQGPGTSFSQIGSLEKGEKLTVMGEQDGWLNVFVDRSEPVVGWIAEFLTKDSP